MWDLVAAWQSCSSARQRRLLMGQGRAGEAAEPEPLPVDGARAAMPEAAEPLPSAAHPLGSAGKPSRSTRNNTAKEASL